MLLSVDQQPLLSKLYRTRNSSCMLTSDIISKSQPSHVSWVVGVPGTDGNRLKWIS